MTPNEINVAIAKELGWSNFYKQENGMQCGISPEDSMGIKWDSEVPNFHESLDACAQFEATLSDTRCEEYMTELENACGAIRSPSYVVYFATAPQRCEAFLRMKGKWI